MRAQASAAHRPHDNPAERVWAGLKNYVANTAVTRSHDYDEVILATSNHEGSWQARTLHLDPIHHLQRRWGKHLTVFTTGPDNKLDH